MSRIREELQRTDRKFMFLCGHDSNLASISSAMRFNLPETQNALELHTPIGSKLVFEKWSDGKDSYVAVNLVYASLDQMHGRTLLTPDVPPMVMPVTVEGLTTNSDGLYRLEDLDARFAEAMAEYEAIEDEATSVSSPLPAVTFSKDPTYTLSGTKATQSARGIIIDGNKKVVRN